MKKILLIMFAVMAFTAHTLAQSVDTSSISSCGNTLYIQYMVILCGRIERNRDGCTIRRQQLIALGESPALPSGLD